MDIDELIARLSEYGGLPFLLQGEQRHSYDDLSVEIERWVSTVESIDNRGAPIGLVANYSLPGIAALLALWSKRACVALVPQQAAESQTYQQAGRLSSILSVTDDGTHAVTRLNTPEGHPLLEELANSGNPGLILYSSGSSGEPKAVLHDFNRFLAKFRSPGKRLLTYAFLVFDHVAGQDTLLYTLNAGGCLVSGASRRPGPVASLIERHRVEVLPASPTFLNLLLASGATESHDLSSVKIITYGSEPMDQNTLNRLGAAFPKASIIQKYGTSEFGALRSRSRNNESLFIEIKADETSAKVVDGILWIKSPGTMMGYLNAPSIEKNGWLCTGDLVEQDGDWLRILGRASDLINVGGEKVVPSAVESVIQQLDDVTDVIVRGESHPLTGMIVVAEITMANDSTPSDPAQRRQLVKTLRRHCRSQLPSYAVPVKFEFATQSSATDRQKKIRR